VPNFDISDERVTCVSCRFRYPSARGFCPACGLVADEATLEAGNQAGAGGLVIPGRTWSALRAPLDSRFGKPTAVVILTVLLVCTAYYANLRGRSIEKTPAARPVGASAREPNIQKASAPPNGSGEVGKFPSEKPRSARITKTEDDDPIGLWRRVRQGSPEAEVALAKLYLQGIAVERSCEQAHVLLSAASRKRSKAADGLLAGAYAQQCQ
jgi:hypothetical protein